MGRILLRINGTDIQTGGGGTQNPQAQITHTNTHTHTHTWVHYLYNNVKLTGSATSCSRNHW